MQITILYSHIERMILEIANIEIKPGLGSDFERAVGKARPIFSAAKGFISLELRHNIEQASLYHLFIMWECLEDHTETFRNSDGFKAWRELVAHYFQHPPTVSHSRVVNPAVPNG